jgi:hypothetical protein
MVRLGLENHHKLQRLLARYAIPVDIPDSLVDIQIALRTAQSSLRQVRKQASKESKELLQRRILEAQMQNDKKTARSSKKISQAEDMKALHSKLRFISQDRNQKSSLNRLEVPLDPQQDPKTCNEWVTVDAPEEITAHLLKHNQKHFSQALGTPFTVPPLNVQVDYGASTASCELMLDSAYNSELLDDLTLLLTDHFRLLNRQDVLPFTITSDAMMDKYNFWPESTTTSPSGRHLGHFRALLPNLKPDTKKKHPLLESKRESLVTIHHSLTAFALAHCHSFHRWKKVVNVMLEKEPGIPKIHRL